MADYLLSTPHGFYFRMKIPLDLRERFGKRELKKALNTADKKKARFAAILYAARATEIFDFMRGVSLSRFPFIGSEMIIKGFEQRADGSVSFESLQTEPHDTLVGNDKILKAIFGTDQSSAIVKPVVATSPAVTGMLLREASIAFISEMGELKSWNEDYKKGMVATFDLATKIIGDLPVDSVTRDHSLNFFKVLKQLPPNMNKTPLYVGKTVAQVLAMKPTQTLSPPTINNNMGRLIAFFDWLVLRKRVDLNVFKELKVEVSKKASEQRDRFEDEELKRIFTHEVFTAHKFTHPYYFWLPLISLHSGMRMNEICCLQPKNIFQKDGVWMMDVNDDGEEKSVKTSAGIRRVPIHPKLIELGFIDFVSKHLKEEWLFAGLTYSEKKKSRSGYASKWFSGFRLQVGLKVKGKDFHSFRHTVVDELKQAQENHHLIKEVIGHSPMLGEMKEDITFDRYGKAYKAATAYELICRLDFSNTLLNVKPWHSALDLRFSNRKASDNKPLTKTVETETDSEVLHSKVFGRSYAKATEGQ